MVLNKELETKMPNITRQLIQSLKICPDSSFIIYAVQYCDHRGNIDDHYEIIRDKLDNIIKYGEEHNKLYGDLIYKVEGLDCPPTESELERMDKLGKLVGLSSYENLNRIIRWTKFKNEQVKKKEIKENGQNSL